jgi:hypothetical protein
VKVGKLKVGWKPVLSGKGNELVFVSKLIGVWNG